MKKVLCSALSTFVITLVVISLMNLALYAVIGSNDRFTFLVIQSISLGFALLLALLAALDCAKMQRIEYNFHTALQRVEREAEAAEADATSCTAEPEREAHAPVSRWGSSRNPSVNVILAICEGICLACEAMEVEQGQAHQEADDETA